MSTTIFFFDFPPIVPTPPSPVLFVYCALALSKLLSLFELLFRGCVLALLILLTESTFEADPDFFIEPVALLAALLLDDFSCCKLEEDATGEVLLLVLVLAVEVGGGGGAALPLVPLLLEVGLPVVELFLFFSVFVLFDPEVSLVDACASPPSMPNILARASRYLHDEEWCHYAFRISHIKSRVLSNDTGCRNVWHCATGTTGRGMVWLLRYSMVLKRCGRQFVYYLCHYLCHYLCRYWYACNNLCSSTYAFSFSSADCCCFVFSLLSPLDPDFPGFRFIT